jgi:hypothetical protein
LAQVEPVEQVILELFKEMMEINVFFLQSHLMAAVVVVVLMQVVAQELQVAVVQEPAVQAVLLPVVEPVLVTQVARVQPEQAVVAVVQELLELHAQQV